MTTRPPLSQQRDSRRTFNFSQKLEIVTRQADEAGEIHCASCGTSIGRLLNRNWMATKRIEFNHKVAHGFEGRTDADNGEAICRHPCHANITRQQVSAMTKADRQGARLGQYQQRIAGKSKQWPKTRFQR